MTFRRVVAVLFAVTFALAVAGCRHDPGDGAAVDPDDPQAACKVITAADMRSIVNIPPEHRALRSGMWRDSPPISDLTGVQFCRYFDPDENLTAFVGLSTFSPDAKAFARTSFERWRREAEDTSKQGGPPLEAVKGLGDTALWNGVSAGGHLVVLDGGRILTVTLSGANQQPALLRAKALAAKGLGRV